MVIRASQHDSGWVSAGRTTCIVVEAVGCLVLVGWLLRIDLFKQIIPGSVAMNPATAVTFLLMAAALWLLQNPDGHRTRHLRGRLLALCAVLIAALKVLELVFGWQIGVDRLLFSAALDQTLNGIPNRIAPNSALAILLIGSALWFLDRRPSPWLSLTLTLAAGALGLFAFLGYIFDAHPFYRVSGYIPMAIHTAAITVALSFGILAVRPNSPFMVVITNRTMGGLTARWLVPTAILVPIVLGWLQLQAQRLGLFPVEVGTMLFATGTLLILLLVVWSTARALLAIDLARSIAEAKITTLNHELATANKELEAFSYSISHDLRAPLRAVNGFSRILVDDYSADLPEEAARYLRLVSSNAVQMGRLIDDLLAFSRLSRQPLKRQPVALDAMVAQVYQELRDPSDTRATEFIVGPLPQVDADPALLKQVYVNLIGNAMKYSSRREQARIEVGAEQRDGKPVFFVRDNGVGFDMKYVNKLFMVFQRLHSADDFEGTGVGLAIIQRIVHRHGGTVWADAKVDQGATFYFTLGEGADENVL